MTERNGFVIAADQQRMRPGPGAHVNWRVPIDRAAGCQNLEQRIVQYRPGCALELAQTNSEDVMYVSSGHGRVLIDGHDYPLSPGTGILAPPGVHYRIENTVAEDLWMVS